MAKQISLSLILPHVGDEKNLRRTLQSLSASEGKIQLLHTGGLPAGFRLQQAVTLGEEAPSDFGQLLNRALPHLLGEFVAVIPPGLEIVRDLVPIFEGHLSKSPNVDYVYGNYFQKNDSGESILVEVNPCPDDITEREDWGPLELYRVSALKEIGGCNPMVRIRHDYDLRLALTFDRPGLRIPQALCTVPYRESDIESGAEALFFPGRGKFGGFSYLFMDPEEEREIEEIFYRALRGNNAYLENPSGVTFPRPAGTSPRVSVIIPVHNRAEFLSLAVSSVQRGRFSDFEIIIVDNASEDDTLQVARRMTEEDSRISVISLPDNVIAKALNAGLRQARGEYIAQLDSDDEYTPDTLEVMIQALDDHLDWALAISYYELMDETGNTLNDFGVIKHLEYNRNNILRVDGAGAVRVWRKAAIEEFGGFNEQDFGHYGEDYDLVLKVSEKYEVGRVHQVLYRYRRHPGNSDALRPHAMKIKNKTLARRRAIRRRQEINQQR